MGMQKIRFQDGNDFVEPRFGRCHFGALAQHRKRCAARRLCPVENPSVDGFFRQIRFGVARGRQMMRLPPEPPLFGQERQRAERIAALQRDRMIENVENAHADHRSVSTVTLRDSISRRLRRRRG